MGRAFKPGFAGRYYGPKKFGVVDVETGQIGTGEALTGEDYDRVYAAMTSVVYQLRTAVGIARSQVADAAPGVLASIAAILAKDNLIASWISDAVEAQSEVAKNVDNGLLLMERQITMREDEMQDVLAGRLEAGRWYAAAKATADGIQSILATLGDYSTGNIVQSEIERMRGEFKRTVLHFVEQVRNVAAIGGTAMLVLAVGAMFLLWPIAKQFLLSYVPQRRQLNGYSKRERRMQRRLLRGW